MSLIGEGTCFTQLCSRGLGVNWEDRLAGRQIVSEVFENMAEPTGLEPATSDVTGRRSNQLNYDSAKN